MLYKLSDIADFIKLLRFWADSQEIYYPVFYEFSENREEDDDSQYDVTYWLSTPACTVSVYVCALNIGDVRNHTAFGTKIVGEHPFILATACVPDPAF